MAGTPVSCASRMCVYWGHYWWDPAHILRDVFYKWGALCEHFPAPHSCRQLVAGKGHRPKFSVKCEGGMGEGIGEIPGNWKVKVQDRKARMEVPGSWVAEPSLATWENSLSTHCS